MKSKKMISILLIVIMGLTLVSCGESKENKEINEDNTQKSEENKVDDKKTEESIVEGEEDYKILQFQGRTCETHVKRNNPEKELREGNWAAWVEDKGFNGIEGGYSTVYTTFYKMDVDGTTRCYYALGSENKDAIMDITFVRYVDGFPALAIIIGDGKKTGDVYLLQPTESTAYRAYKCGTRERVNKVIDKENEVMELEIYKYKDESYTDYDIIKKDIKVKRITEVHPELKPQD